MTRNLKIGLLLIIAINSAHPRRTIEGEPCTISAGVRGVCKRLRDCQSSIRDLYGKGKSPVTCAIEGVEPIVCCREGDSDFKTGTGFPENRINDSPKLPPRRGNHGKVALKKCEEYSLSIIDYLAKHRKNCMSLYLHVDVVGGHDASPIEFPHMAHLGYDIGTEILWQCGGSLISDEYIMTAAHCLTDGTGTPVSWVKLGNGNKTTTVQLKVAESIIHPNFTRVGLYNDIALLRLDEPIKEFNMFMRPACLDVFDEPVYKALACGWGRLEYAGDIPNDLMEVALPVLPHSECIKTWHKRGDLPRGIDENVQFCSGGLGENRDTCDGDSGGPIQVLLDYPFCAYRLLGITSFGSRCGMAPGVYVRVSSFVEWIESIVWKNE